MPATPIVGSNLVQRDRVQPGPESLGVFECVEYLQHFRQTLLHDVRGEVPIQRQAAHVLRQPGLRDQGQVAPASGRPCCARRTNSMVSVGSLISVVEEGVRRC